MSIHENLRQLRRQRGLTQQEVADQIAVTRQTVSGYESGRTRPDLETLQALCRVYQCDLDAILYGEEKRLKAARRAKTAAWLYGGVLLLLQAVGSALLWCANRFYWVESGPVSAEEMVLLQARIRLTEGWMTLDRVSLALSLWGGIVLLILLQRCRGALSAKTKLLFAAGLTASLLGMAVLFGTADAVYPVMNYLTTPLWVCGRVWVLLLIDAVLGFFQTKK